MYNEIVKVYGEDLVEADLTKTVIGEKPISGGGTMGALVVNIFASGVVKVAADTFFEILAADDADSEFVSIRKENIPTGDYNDGDLITTVEIPFSAPRLLKGKVTGATGNSGAVVAMLGYLAR